MRSIFPMTMLVVALTISAHETRSASAQLFLIVQHEKYGYIDDSGRIVIPPRFDDAENFSEGLAPVLVDDKWGYIDQTGKLVIAPRFFAVMPFKEGRAVAGVFFKSGPINSRVGNYGYIDKTGALVIPPQFGVAFNFSNGLARIQSEDYRNGCIDKTGKVIFWNEQLEKDFAGDLALFKTHGNMADSRTGYLDRSGKVVISPKYDRGESFSEGLACVLLGKKAGFIDNQGKITVDFRFDDCRSFSEGLAAVMVGNRWGYIDKSGKIMIEPGFAEAEQFSDGVAVIRLRGESGSYRQEQRYKVSNNIVSVEPGKFGVVARSGSLILPPRFVQLGNFSGGLAWVNLGDDFIVHGYPDKWGYVNKSGKIVWSSFGSPSAGSPAAQR